MNAPVEKTPERKEKRVLLSPERRKALNALLIIASLTIVICLLLTTSAFAFAKTSNNHILGHITVAGVPVGGLDRLSATEAIQKKFDTLVAGGLSVKLFGESANIDLAPSGSTDPDLVYPLLDADVTMLVNDAYQTGRGENPFISFFSPLWYATLGKKEIPANVTLAETKLTDAIRSAYPNAESPGSPTDFVITKNGDDWDIAVTAAVSGSTIDLQSAFAALKKDADDLRVSPLKLELVERGALISKEQAETLIPEVKNAIAHGPYALTFTNEDRQSSAFPVSVENLTIWLKPIVGDDGKPELTLDTYAMGDLLAEIHTKIDISPHDAVFATDGNRVTNFEPSREGLRVDDDALVASLVAAFENGTKEVAISAARSEPTVTTAASNDYGIKELLGTGISNYGNSPSNRIKNIQHGASKLNGLLVAPGETLSLIENLRPFTIEDGYLPELVIKGDEIKPEVGGGLCQIGTTTFRASMNSGLDIAERRNHSLVVSYYNDPANNNPGTDATIYDPAPDFKVKNDTSAYILLTTNVDTKTHGLTFSFWGTSDGREGSYTPPKVLSWTGYGETVIKETDTLAPGKKSCQAAHPGASTIFTYNIKKTDGTVISREFPSTYRSLPQICLVGKELSAPPSPPADPSAEVIPLE
jgi:vancomycin resistance protein YoaR